MPGSTASDVEEVLLVGGMTRWPAVQASVERIFGRKPSKGANPDEVVALGAAAYAGILAGDSDDAALLDVTPHDLGIKVGDSGFSVLIPRNSMLPVRARKLFATTTDDQRFVSIERVPGRIRPDVGKNRKLGQVVLDDLPPGPPASVRVELVMTVDVESILGGHRARAQDRPRGQRDDPALGWAVAARDRRDHQPPASRVIDRWKSAERGRAASCESRRASSRDASSPTSRDGDHAVDPAVLKVADAVGALIEAWGFKRNMGRMWAVLYLEDHPADRGRSR